jgi:hypothetical protein
MLLIGCTPKMLLARFTTPFFGLRAKAKIVTTLPLLASHLSGISHWLTLSYSVQNILSREEGCCTTATLGAGATVLTNASTLNLTHPLASTPPLSTIAVAIGILCLSTAKAL